MMKTIMGLLEFVISTFFSMVEGIANLISWLVTLNNTQSEVSMVGERFVKVATFLISYATVGFVFNKLGLFDKKGMKFAYFIISTIVSFGLCFIVMLLEKYIVTIAIIFAVVILLLVGIAIYLYYRKKRK